MRSVVPPRPWVRSRTVGIMASLPSSGAAFVLCLDAINFGSGWWLTVRKRAGRSGYLTMASGLADASGLTARGPQPALAEIESNELAEVLDQDLGHEILPLFATALRDLAAHGRDDAGGSFLRVVTEADGSGCPRDPPGRLGLLL